LTTQAVLGYNKQQFLMKYFQRKYRNKILRTVKLTHYLKVIRHYGFASLCLLATKQKTNINQNNVFEHQNNYLANSQVAGD